MAIDIAPPPVPAGTMAHHHETKTVSIAAPGTTKLNITGQTNADYHQKVTVTDVASGKEFIFRGQGEGNVMNLESSTKQTLASLTSVNNLYRQLKIVCEHSVDGTTFAPSEVLYPRSWAEYDGDKLKRISWEVSSEDGGDQDFNDSVITIVAEMEQ